ncbi:MAG: hypothetical protein KGL74_00360, partial [Elusimicrobia bacterium]|nr:hypothetical protein [Elusimicrobiota bacterium]
VRERLLDWVQTAIDANIPETKARMIRLEARQAVAEASGPASAAPQAALQILPALFVLTDGKALALCANAELAAELEKDAELPALLRQRGQFERAGWRLVFRQATAYGERTVYDYTAVKSA